MIKHLYIKNFILIHELNLDFENGFSAFIGETGAGKSILVDAISLLCAERASTSMISAGKEKAIVEGTFDLSGNTHALNVLKDAGFDTEDEVTFTREILSSGKAVVRIDHRIATLSLMREALLNEIDIHGQRDTQYLLNTSEHLHLLDEYIHEPELLQKTRDAYDVYHTLTVNKENTLRDVYNESDLEYFHYQIQEIDSYHLRVGEDEELEEKERQYKSVKSSLDKLNQILEIYDHAEDDLYQLQKLFSSVSVTDLEDASRQVTDGYYNISDAMDSLRKVRDSYSLSEEEINAMEERLYDLQRLKRKYGGKIEDILNHREELNQKIMAFEHRREYLEKIDKQIEQALKAYKVQAEKLTKARTSGAEKLDQEILVHLRDLSLPNARFKTIFKPTDPSPRGDDQVEFMISMNKGEELKPLSRTASGGELSRLMLGLKVIFTQLKGIQTVIFDEIDAGVSGPVAGAIGQKMHSLARSGQVFSITHLAPVAACADHHYLVEKSSDALMTNTNVRKLNNEEVIRELALISSGTITNASLAASEELIRRSKDEQGILPH